MSENPRDTQFKNFAKLLYEEFIQLAREDDRNAINLSDYHYPENWRNRVERLITQRAYDLAVHIVEKLDASPLVTLSDRIGYHEEFVNKVPDMTEWPKIDG